MHREPPAEGPAMTDETEHQLKIRITSETMEWLRRRAKKNFRSATAEIQAILAQMMEADAAAPEAQRK